MSVLIAVKAFCMSGLEYKSRLLSGLSVDSPFLSVISFLAIFVATTVSAGIGGAPLRLRCMGRPARLSATMRAGRPSHVMVEVSLNWGR